MSIKTYGTHLKKEYLQHHTGIGVFEFRVRY